MGCGASRPPPARGELPSTKEASPAATTTTSPTNSSQGTLQPPAPAPGVLRASKGFSHRSFGRPQAQKLMTDLANVGMSWYCGMQGSSCLRPSSDGFPYPGSHDVWECGLCSFAACEECMQRSPERGATKHAQYITVFSRSAGHQCCSVPCRRTCRQECTDGKPAPAPNAPPPRQGARRSVRSRRGRRRCGTRGSKAARLTNAGKTNARTGAPGASFCRWSAAPGSKSTPAWSWSGRRTRWGTLRP